MNNKLNDVCNRFNDNLDNHKDTLKQIKNPYDRQPEIFSYNAKFKEIIDDTRALLTLEEYFAIEPQLLLNFDIYATIT